MVIRRFSAWISTAKKVYRDVRKCSLLGSIANVAAPYHRVLSRGQ
jgi:hypothetical protein